MPYLTAKEIGENTINWDTARYIPEEQHRDLLWKSQIRRGQVLIAMAARLGISCVFDEDFECNSSQNIAKVTLRDGLDPYYVSTFINSKYGRSQLISLQTGSIQQHTNLGLIQTVQIVIAPDSVQQKVARKVKDAEKARNLARQLYTDAENLLASELGLDKVDLSNDIYSIRNVSNVKSFGRIDAEFYQEKYSRFARQLEKIKHKGWFIQTIANLSAPPKYGSSTKLDYIESGIPFLRIADIRKYRFDPDEIKYISPEAAKEESPQAKVKFGDVLISRTGTLGLSISIPKELENSVFGSYMIRVRPQNNAINSIYLSLYLNSIAGKLQVEQSNTGAIQTNLTIPVIEAIRVVIPPNDIQKMFAKEAEKSFAAQDEAKHLLAEAKAEVEKLIEEK